MEPKELIKARECLAQFEQDYLGQNALDHLSDGLTLLEDVIDSHKESKYSRIAKNIGNTYISRLEDHIEISIKSDTTLQEKVWQNYQKLLVEIRNFSYVDTKKLEQILRDTTVSYVSEILRVMPEIDRIAILTKFREDLNKH